MVTFVRSAVFRERALIEGARYAKDKMVFLREFCQNSRDAGASQIVVKTFFEQDLAVLTFEDNGHGMSLSHAKKYLFTLYASSKENETLSAGRFGVGFWSFLLSAPSEIEIESKTKNEKAWKISLSGDLHDYTFMNSSLDNCGTGITLRYPSSVFCNEEELTKKTKEALTKYCLYLRDNSKNAKALPISVNGKVINKPISIDGARFLYFETGTTQGAIGLSDVPSVSVFARGLPVWQGTVLSELQYGGSKDDLSFTSDGPAPCYVLNGDKLNVTMDRRAVIDDAELKKLRRTAERRMDEFMSLYLDTVSPIKTVSKILLLARKKSLYLFFALLSVLAITAFLTVRYASDLFSLVSSSFNLPQFGNATNKDDSSNIIISHQKPPTLRSFGNPGEYWGATVGGSLSDTDYWALLYRPPVDVTFRMAAMESLHLERGIVGKPPSVTVNHPQVSCKDSDCIYVALAVDTPPGLFVLPVPTGYVPVGSSISLNGQSSLQLLISESDEPIIIFNRSFKGKLTYTVTPYKMTLSSFRRRLLLEIPKDMKMPEILKSQARLLLTETQITNRISMATDFVATTIAYDDSVETVKAYKKFKDSNLKRNWLDFVLGQKKGDCDVQNAVLSILLRLANIPSRLAVGPVGKNGRTEAGLHAWVEYYDNGWQMADASLRRVNNDESLQNITSSQNNDATEPSTNEHEPVQIMSNTMSSSHDEVTSTFDDILNSTFIKTLPIIIACTFLMLFFLIVLKMKTKSILHLKDIQEDRRLEAAKLAASAISNPKMWNNVNTIFSRPFLLSIEGSSITVNQAKRLLTLRKLYAASSVSNWTKQALHNKITVLDLNDKAVLKISPFLTGMINLDELAALNPVSPKEMTAEYALQGHLADKINDIIAASGLRKKIRLMLSLSATFESSREFCLSGIHIPENIVVLSIFSHMMLKALNIAEIDEDRAVEVLIRDLIKPSDTMSSIKDDLMEEASRRVLSS